MKSTRFIINQHDASMEIDRNSLSHFMFANPENRLNMFPEPASFEPVGIISMKERMNNMRSMKETRTRN